VPSWGRTSTSSPGSTSNGRAMKQRKIAISLAVTGALTAPFVLQTYKMEYELWWQTWTPLTATDIQQIKTTLAEKCSNGKGSEEACQAERKHLEDGGYYAIEPSVALYLLLNAGIALVSFVIVFGLTYLLSALARRYWRWLNT
jgi:hypothetical protein